MIITILIQCTYFADISTYQIQEINSNLIREMHSNQVIINISLKFETTN